MQLALHLGDQLGDVGLLERQSLAADHRIGRQARRAMHQVECQREKRDQRRHRSCDRCAPRRKVGTGLPVALLRVGAREQSARDLGVGRQRLGLAHPTEFPFGFDLLELVTIDGERARCRAHLGAWRTHERGQEDGQRHGRQHCEEEPEQHVLPMGEPPLQ
jgi:hypothetical protein